MRKFRIGLQALGTLSGLKPELVVVIGTPDRVPLPKQGKLDRMREIAGLAQGIGGGATPILMMVAIFGVFYVLLILPQQRRQKKWQAMLSQVKPGDKVVTSGGLTGAVMSVKDDAVVLRVPPDNIKLEVSRSSIVTLTTTEDAKS
jgi:preprotein translocase subunit YajC